MTKCLPKKKVPVLLAEQPEFDELPAVIKQAKCWTANTRPTELFLCNKIFMSETINRCA